jgi:hypothetical protein
MIKLKEIFIEKGLKKVCGSENMHKINKNIMHVVENNKL